MEIIQAIFLVGIIVGSIIITIASLMGKMRIPLIPLLVISLVLRLVLIHAFVDVPHYDANSYKIIGDTTLLGNNIYPEAAVQYHPYLPFLLYIEAIAAYLSQFGMSHMLYMKLFFSFFDFLNIIVLYFLSNKNLKIALLYAMNPTFLFLASVHGQIDQIPLFFLMLAAYVLQKNKEWVYALLFGVGIMIKTWPLFLLAVFTKHARNKIRFLVLAGIPSMLSIGIYSIFFHVPIKEIVLTTLSYRGSTAYGLGIIIHQLIPFPEQIALLVTELLSTDTVILLSIIFLFFTTRNIIKDMFFFLLVFCVFSVRGANPIWLFPFMLLVRPKFWSIWILICGIYMGLSNLVEILDPLHLPISMFLSIIDTDLGIILWILQLVMLVSYSKIFLQTIHQKYRNLFPVQKEQ